MPRSGRECHPEGDEGGAVILFRRMSSEMARAATGRGWAQKAPARGGGRALPVLAHGRSYAQVPLSASSGAVDQASTSSAAFSPIISVGALVLAEVTFGITDASAT